jgi:hypothetical protein
MLALTTIAVGDSTISASLYDPYLNTSIAVNLSGPATGSFTVTSGTTFRKSNLR